MVADVVRACSDLHLNMVLLSLIFESLFPGIRRGHVTRLGEFLVQFPLPPNLTCAVIKAASLDCEDLLLPIAAMLSVENVFIRPGGKPPHPKAAAGGRGIVLAQGCLRQW